MRKFIIMLSLAALVGCKEKTDPAFGALVEKAMNDLRAKTAAHTAGWGLGSAERWKLDQTDGHLVFTFPDKSVTCEAQIIGFLDMPEGRWVWAWADAGVRTNIAAARRELRAYVKTPG